MPVTNMLRDVTEFEDEGFQGYLDELVWPLLRFVRATLPQMIERRSGKIVGITSATPLRAIPGLSTYSAARGAQNAFVKVVGNEVAAQNVQFNAIGPAHIENNMYYTAEMLEDESVREQFVAEIPAGRLGVGAEAAELALSLSTEASDFLAGQVIPRSPVGGRPEQEPGHEMVALSASRKPVRRRQTAVLRAEGEDADRARDYWRGLVRNEQPSRL
jgi:2-keto-3-deoxy-L-fuconate dehydrogenase